MKRILLSIIALAVLSHGANAQNVNIPDINFKNYLVGNTAINTNLDAEIQVSEASAFTGPMDCSGLSVADMTGIEAFTSLSKLYCSDNSLSTLDLSQNIALTWLFCYNNSLTTLDLSANTALNRLWCYNNSLNALDVSQSAGLAWLYCYDNSLLSLDVSNSALTQFNCKNNSLTSLNVSNGDNMSLANSDFSVINNPNLSCIQVDDAVWSTTNWTNIDSGASFSENCGVGIDEITFSEVNVYPNPASSQITIDSYELVEGIKIFSMFGELVQQEILKSFSVSSLPNGVYIMNIQTSNGMVRSRFIKE